MKKIIGNPPSLTSERALLKLETLNALMNELRPYKKPRGMVLKFKTYDEHYEFSITRAANKI